jgi:hypothetical protein
MADHQASMVALSHQRGPAAPGFARPTSRRPLSSRDRRRPDLAAVGVRDRRHRQLHPPRP